MGIEIPLTSAAVVGIAFLFSIFFFVPEFYEFRTTWPPFVPLIGSEGTQFELVTPGLYKLDLPWHLTPFHQETLDLFLIKSKGGWCLSDAGGYDTWVHKHASELTAAVKKVIGEAPLTYVLLTHGHLDHVGALPILMDIYPDMKVVIHEDEAEYIAGGKSYNTGEKASFSIQALTAIKALPGKEFKMAKDRLITLEGKQGALSSIGIPEVTWTHTPGHSPGHVVYLHSSKYLLGGDFADVLDTNGTASLLTMCGGTCDMSLAKKSICTIAQDLEFDTILPYHDAFKKGYSKAELKPLAESYAQCSA